MRGSRPSPANVEESVSGALLGFPGAWCVVDGAACSTFGLYENREDMTCAFCRGFDGPEGCGCFEYEGGGRAWASESVRGRFDGRSVCFSD